MNLGMFLEKIHTMKSVTTWRPPGGADHLPPSSAEVASELELHLHLTYLPAKFMHGATFAFTFCYPEITFVYINVETAIPTGAPRLLQLKGFFSVAPAIYLVNACTLTAFCSSI